MPVRSRLVFAADDDGGQASKRGPVAGLAEGGFGVHEALEVAGEQGLHHGVVGVVALQQHGAGGFGAAGAAGDLVEKLEGALAGAEVAAG